MVVSPFPRFLRVQQSFPRPPPVAIAATIAEEMAKLRPRLRPGARIAVGVGSRGIANLEAIVRAVLDQLRAAGTRPFIIPAMGSHGGATPEGQRAVLATYGITAEAMGVPIHDSLAVRQVGASVDGVPAFCSVEALGADGIFLINRVKPHTDFFSRTLGSGLVKMCVIGLGKQVGASAMHQAATRIGHERAIHGLAAVLLESAPVLGGLAILENPLHETARLVVLRREEVVAGEPGLLGEARSLMPLLPFDEIDLLIIDRIGKNISGAGMDPNVINRSVLGYSSSLIREGGASPFIRRIFVRGLTQETHGNAIGIGLADVTTTRLVREMDARVTSINALTAMTPQSAKIPICFDSDREAIERTLASLALDDPRSARVARIADTLSLAEMDVSESLWADARNHPALSALTGAQDLRFDGEGNLAGR